MPRFWSMTMLDAKEVMIVFDLDDTLYSEIDYRISGAKAVSRFVYEVCSINIESQINQLARLKNSDFLSEACRLSGLPLTAKECLLWVYRLHFPELTLHEKNVELLDFLKRIDIPFAILTDGRSVSQRLKLKALGLEDVRAYISEEWNSEKPDELRFCQIMQHYPNKHYVYVGDNPDKDFIAPKSLGWTTFQLKKKTNFIHQASGYPELNSAADFELSDLPELINWIALELPKS